MQEGPVKVGGVVHFRLPKARNGAKERRSPCVLHTCACLRVQQDHTHWPVCLGEKGPGWTGSCVKASSFLEPPNCGSMPLRDAAGRLAVGEDGL